MNHIDTAASLRRLGAAARAVARRSHRDRVLPRDEDRPARPTRGRARRSAARSTGSASTSVDLIQLHNLVDVIEWEIALREGGALEAAVEARDEGLVRFIGVTGHGLSVAGDAPAQPRALPVRLGARCPTTTSRCRTSAMPPTFEALAAVCARARRRRADDQGDRARAVGRPRADGADVVRAADRAGRHRPCGALGARARRASSSTPSATSRCCRRHSTQRAATSPGRPTRPWTSSPNGGGSFRSFRSAASPVPA